MKKNTERRKKWFALRARNEAKRAGNARIRKKFWVGANRHHHVKPVQIWEGGASEWAIVKKAPAVPPSVLCLNRNPFDTTELFSWIRSGFDRELEKPEPGFIVRRSKNATPRINSYIDFAKIKDISTAAAVVLTADYDRGSTLMGVVPPTVNINSWNDGVLTKLYELGYFNILGHIPDLENRLIKHGPTLTMSIVKGKQADILSRIDPSLQTLGKFIIGEDADTFRRYDETMVKVLTTISEAITNVTQHAYDTAHEYTSQHIDSFWVAAEADRDAKKLTVVIYDQGVTIPVTYPRLERTKRVMRYLKRFIGTDPEFDYQYDGTYIRAALKFGGSRTDQPYRGKGFPQMFRLLGSIGAGKLSIRSRGGWCEQESGSKVVHGSLPHSIGGTLIEWTVELDKI